MSDPTDLEITRACAEMMGYSLRPDGSVRGVEGEDWEYAPITDDAQNAELDDVMLKYGGYEMQRHQFVYWPESDRWNPWVYAADMTVAANRRRARCLCVWKIWEENRAL